MILYIIFFILFFLIIYRYFLLYKLYNFKNPKLDIKNTNLLYDDYYKNSNNKLNNKLYKNIGIIRKNYFNDLYDFDIELLNLENNFKILIINTLDIDFELSIINKFNKLNKKIYLFSCCNNLLETYFLKKKNKHYNHFITYCNNEDIHNKFNNIKFDRIILRENLGNISNRYTFLKNIKSLLKNKNSFIFIKTFTFDNNIQHNPIFEKQKYLINYWNYNFSTYKSIINDLLLLKYKVKYSKINLLDSILLSNHKDIINNLKLFFVNMNKNINDLDNWFIIYSIELLFLKIYN